MTKITGFDTFDVRFPTSRTLAGSDAMNAAPDYSAAYVVIRTDAPDPALSGHGFAFTIGRGNDVQLAAIRLLEPFLAGQDLDEVLADLGGLGYSDERLAALCAEAVAEGFTQVKIKVGAALEDDKRRCAIAREVVGDDIGIAIDANQVWDVPTAIAWISELASFQPAWVEEPTAPEDILGTAAIRRGVRPVRVATGEHVANPVMFKQLLQAGAMDVMQIDACRVAGVNENIANLLLAAKFGVPVCPHAGGVGLCEIVQHLSMFDYVALSGTMQGRRIEWIDHLHEHFAAPATVTRGRYHAPQAPGASTEILPQSLAEYTYPSGPAWRDDGMP